MIRRFCMSGVSRQSGAVAASLQVTCSRPREAPPVAGVRNTYSSMQIGLAPCTLLERLGVEIGQADVEFEILDPALDLLARQRQDRDGDAGKARVERPGQLRDDRQRRRDRADPQPPGQALVDLLEAAAQILRLREDAMRVFEREPALRRQADEAMAALDDRRAEILLEQADRRRQRRLRDMAGLGRAAEMLFPRQRDKIFELTQHHRAALPPHWWRPSAAKVNSERLSA